MNAAAVGPVTDMKSWSARHNSSQTKVETTIT